MSEETKKIVVIAVAVVAVAVAGFSIFRSTTEPVGKGVPLPPTRPGYGTDGTKHTPEPANPNPAADPDADEKGAAAGK